MGSCERKCDTCQELTGYYSWLQVSTLAIHLRSPWWWRKGEWLGFAHWSSEMTAETSNTLAQGGLLAARGASLCSLLQRICSGAPLERLEGARCLSSVQALPQPPVWPLVSHLPSICLNFQTLLEAGEDQPCSPPTMFVDIIANNVDVQVSLREHHGVSYDWEWEWVGPVLSALSPFLPLASCLIITDTKK